MISILPVAKNNAITLHTFIRLNTSNSLVELASIPSFPLRILATDKKWGEMQRQRQKNAIVAGTRIRFFAKWENTFSLAFWHETFTLTQQNIFENLSATLPVPPPPPHRQNKARLKYVIR